MVCEDTDHGDKFLIPLKPMTVFSRIETNPRSVSSKIETLSSVCVLTDRNINAASRGQIQVYQIDHVLLIPSSRGL